MAPSWKKLKAATELIRSVGGKVQLLNTTIVVWGEVFRSIKQLSTDSRCKVTLASLKSHIQSGYSYEDATKPAPSTGAQAVMCWGELFPSMAALIADPRCEFKSISTIKEKLKRGVRPEEAVKRSPRKGILTIDQVLAKPTRGKDAKLFSKLRKKETDFFDGTEPPSRHVKPPQVT
jgi:hypothetical protein